MNGRWWLWGTLTMIGCGQNTAPPTTAPPATEDDSDREQAKHDQPSASDAVVPALPTSVTCYDGAECLPRPSFTRGTCQGRFPGMAIKMFEQGSPWKRLYVNAARLEPMNTHGGKTTTPLETGEEVLLLRRQADGENGLSVSSTDVDVLRWDGSCATLPAEFLSEEAAPKRNAPINFQYLDDSMSAALLEEKDIKLAHSKEKELCRGDPESLACAQAKEKLSRAVVDAVEAGLTLPEPDLLPEWNIQE